MPNAVLTDCLERLLAGDDIGREGAQAAVGVIMDDQAEDPQIAGFLIALRAKGETAEELAGIADAVRARAEVVTVDESLTLVDTCGTGGGPGTVNISTGAAFLAAGAGAHVAKHGNRAVTSSSGSADVLEALGATVDLAPEAIAQCITEVGVGFMFAPGHHPAFRHVGPVRKALGVRTAFNLVGPLANPAGAHRQVIGVNSAEYLERVALAIGGLGTERAMVVRGRDGLDEISTMDVTDVLLVEEDRIDALELSPAVLGVPTATLDDLAGGGPERNAQVLRAAIGGEPGPVRDILVVNAAAALWMAGIAHDMADGMARAEQAATGGAAKDVLERFIDMTGRLS